MMMMGIVIQQKRFVGYLICLLGFGLTLFAFYPGQMSPDSIASLNEGRSGIIYDQNSPLMSYLWGCLDQLVAGPGLMLILQVAAFWLAIALLWEATHRESVLLAVALILFPFMPQILSQLPVIWKDVGMATALLMAVSLVYLAQKRKSKFALLLSPVFLLYAFAARLNSIPAVLPIAIWSGFVAASLFDLRISRVGSTAIGISYFALMLAVAFAVQMSITGGRTSYPFQFVMLYDLAAISLSNNETTFPAYIAESKDFSMEKVKANYDSTTVGGLVYEGQTRNGEAPALLVTEDAQNIADLRAKWFEQIAAPPAVYLHHRLGVFAQLIGLRRSVGFQFWDLDLSRNPSEFHIETNAANGILTSYFRLFQRPVMQTFFFRGIIWILCCAYIFYRGWKSRLQGDWSFAFVLAASSLLYIFSYFVTAPAADFRYIYWPAIASAIAAIFAIYLIRRERTKQEV